MCRLLMVLLVFSVLVMGCTTDNIPDPTTIRLSLAWQQPADQTYDTVARTMPLVYEDFVILNNDTYIEKRAIGDGDMIWRADLGDVSPSRSVNMIVIDDVVYIQARHRYYGFKIDDGSLVFYSELEDYLPSGGAILSSSGNTLYSGGINEFNVIHTNSGTVTRVSLADYLEITYNRYVYHIITNPDMQNLYIPTTYYDEEEGQLYGELLCLNKVTYDVVWFRSLPKQYVNNDGISIDVNRDGYSGHISNDVLYVNGSEAVQAFDMTTGDDLWLTRLSGRVINNPLKWVDGYLYTGTSIGLAYCLNASDGSIIWKQDLIYGLATTFSFSQGYMFVSGGYGDQLWMLDRFTGEIVWRDLDHPSISDDFVTPSGVSDRHLVTIGFENIHCFEFVE